MPDDTITDISSIVGASPPPYRPSNPNALPQAIAGAQAIEKDSGLDEAQKKMAEVKAKENALRSSQEEDAIKGQGDVDKIKEDIAKSDIDALAGRPTASSEGIRAPEYQPLTMQDIQSNAIPLLIAATIAGKGQRRHAMGALSAFGSMINGAAEGKKELYEASNSRYKAALDNLKNDQEEFDRRSAVIRANKNLTLTQKQDQINLLNMERGHEINDAMRDAGGYSLQIDQENAHKKLIEDLFKQYSNFDAKAQSTLKKTAPTISVETADRIAEEILSGNRVAANSLGMGSSADKKFVEERVTIKAKERRLSGADIAAAHALLTAQTAAARNAETRAVAVERLEKSFSSLGPMLKDLASKGLPGGVKVVNAPINYLREHLSSEDLTNLRILTTELPTQYVEAMTMPGSNAQMNEGARIAGALLLNPEMTFGQVMQAYDTMQKILQSNGAAMRNVVKSETDQIRAGNQPDKEHGLITSDKVMSLDDYLKSKGH